MTHDHEPTTPATAATETDSRSSRRHLLRYAVGGAGLLALAGSGVVSLRQTLAKDGEDDDDDNSGHGSGGDDSDNSGHGSDNSGHGHGGDDRDERDEDDDRDDDAVTVTGEIPEGSVEVSIVDDDADGFSPGELTIDLGQSVTFVNRDDDPHTATGSGFDTGIMQPGQTATVVFDTAGRFAYACQIHPEMIGSIAVRDANGQVPERSTSSATTADATPVSITNFAFDPPTLQITTGTTVSWSNDDSAPHTVTALDRAFDSGIFDSGASFAWEFTQPGTYAYRCDLHPAMEGAIEVTGDPVATGSPVASPAASPEAEPATPTAEPTPEPALTPIANTATDEVTVTITNFLFDPPTVEIPAGSAITWINQDAAPHTATALDSTFDTGRIDQGQEASLVFDIAGTFDYRCSFHPSMVAQIIVT